MLFGTFFLLLALLRGCTTFHLPWTERNPLHEKRITNSSMSKILGGSKAEYGKYPFIVSLERNGQHICGGSVIGKHWLVTASHCLSLSYLREGMVIRAGSMNKEEGGTVHQVDKIVLHPDFDLYPMFDSDVALIRVKEPFTSNKYVKFVHLGKQKDVPKEGDEVVAAGWGVTTNRGYGETSRDLLDVTLRTVDNDKCDSMPGINRIREYMSDTVKISHNMVCAIADSKDTTKGDSGGPLLEFKAGDEEPLLVGVVSWGDGNGHLDSPGVYTSVANFVKWIYLQTVTLPGSSA